MSKLILIKLGGSLITDKSKELTAKPEVISRLGAEIKSAMEDMESKIIIAHGSGSFGHSVASKYKTQDGIVDKNSLDGFSLVANAASQINRVVVGELLNIGLRAVSFSPLSMMTVKDKIPNQVGIDPVLEALELGILPVLYGDVILDKKSGFCIFSSEKILSILSEKLRDFYEDISIIYCGNTNGVYNSDGKTISEITPKLFQDFKKYVTGSDQVDVTGGMLHKVTESISLAKKGITTNIVNGNNLWELKKAILGEKTNGTLIKS